MEFGLFYEIQIPKAWGPQAEARVFHEVVEQVRLAERVGFTSFWTVEHHFLEEFSHSSAPEVLYGYIAALTETIKIGHGVRLLPFPYNHPVRVAEMAATLDILSNGRLQFGTGRSITQTELGGFGIEPSQTREMWDEALRMVVEMWKDEPFSHDGKHFQIPERNVVPKPVQSPHPPLWMAASTPPSHELAGKLGLGVLSLTLAVHPREIGDRIRLYREALNDAEPVGATVNNQAAVFILAHCGATTAQAKADAEAGVMYYMRHQIEGLYSQAGQFGEGYEYYQKFLGVDYSKFNFEYLDSRNMVMVGDTARCKEVAQIFASEGVDHLLLHVQTYGIPHAQVMESIRRFGEEVIPQFA